MLPLHDAAQTNDKNFRRPHSASSRGRATDLNSAEIEMLLMEVLASNAHTAPHGWKAEIFERAANSLNGNRDFIVQVDGKIVEDRY